MNVPSISLQEYIDRRETRIILERLSLEGPCITFIIGNAGSGKTTIAAFCADKAVNQGLCESAEWISRSDSTESLQQKFKESNSNKLIVLDGLDEFPASTQASLMNLMQEFINASKGHILVTSRQFPKWWTKTRATTVFQLGPLNQEESYRLLKNILKDKNKALTENELSSIISKAYTALSSARGNPLVVRLLADSIIKGVDFEQWSIPGANLKNILRSMIDKLSRQSQDVLKALSQFETPVTTRSLMPLVPGVNRTDLTKILNQLVSNSLIIETEGHYGLIHQTVKDFLRAQHFERGKTLPPGDLYITFDPKVMDKDDVMELLGNLDVIYKDFGGDELVIQKDGKNKQGRAVDEK